METVVRGVLCIFSGEGFRRRGVEMVDKYQKKKKKKRDGGRAGQVEDMISEWGGGVT